MKPPRSPTEVRGNPLPRSFYQAPPELVAPRLLGKILIHRLEHAGRTQCLAGRIVEVEAYLGPHHAVPDPAAHSHRGPTPRNQVLFGPPGHAYVYSIYGQYFCMNVSCEEDGLAGCVLIRALEPVTGIARMAHNRGLAANARPHHLTSGPGRLCQALGLSRAQHNGIDLTQKNSSLRIVDDNAVIYEAQVTVRIGIRHAVELPLRFAIPEHTCLSGPRNLQSRRILVP